MVQRATSVLVLSLLALAPAQGQDATDVKRAFATVRPTLEGKANHMLEGSQYYLEGRATAEDKQGLQRAFEATQAMQVEVVKGEAAKVVYDAKRNRILVSEGTLEALRARVKGLPQARRASAIHDALSGLMTHEGVKALYRGPQTRYPVRATDVLYRELPGARYAMLDQDPGKDPLRFMEVVARQGPLPHASGLTDMSGVSKAMARNLRTVESSLRVGYGLSLEVRDSKSTVAVDGENMRMTVSRAALAAIDAKAKASANPEQYRRAALTQLLAATAGEVRGMGAQTNWERFYMEGTAKRLLRGDLLTAPKGAPIAGYWGPMSDALNRGLNWAYDMPGEGVRMQGLVVEKSTKAEIGFDSTTKRVRVTTAMLEAIQAEARTSAHPRAFAQQVLAEMANRVGSRASGVGDTYAQEIMDKGRELQLKEGVKKLSDPLEFSERVESLGRSELAKKVRADLEPLRPNAEKLPYMPRSGWTEALEDPKKRYRTRAEFEAEYLAKLRATYRLPSGRLDWKRLGRDKALREGGALGHFALALFLKELAVVAQTGDRARIEEFFDGLTEIGFYKHYGLFALGARAGEVAYARFLQRHIKPVFVSGILKTNVILATGLALPQLVEGNFSGKGFAISLGALGLSSSAVRAGVASLKWVKNLRRGKQVSTAGRAGVAMGRLARAGGWLYTAAELAVVLYLAEDIEQRVHSYLDRKAALDAMRDAGVAFFAAVNDSQASDASVEEAARTYRDAGTAYRDYLYSPLLNADVVFSQRLEKIARKAKLAEGRTQAALTKLKSLPALRARLDARGETLEAYATRLSADANAEVSRDLSEAMQRYQKDRLAKLASIYEAKRRPGKLLEGISGAAWVAGGARQDAEGDPYPSRRDVFARRGRQSTQRAFHSQLRDRLSANRLQSYEDELELLGLMAQSLRARGKTSHAEAVERVSALTRRTGVRDKELFRGGAQLGGAVQGLDKGR